MSSGDRSCRHDPAGSTSTSRADATRLAEHGGACWTMSRVMVIGQIVDRPTSHDHVLPHLTMLPGRGRYGGI